MTQPWRRILSLGTSCGHQFLHHLVPRLKIWRQGRKKEYSFLCAPSYPSSNLSGTNSSEFIPHPSSIALGELEGRTRRRQRGNRDSIDDAVLAGLKRRVTVKAND